MGRRKRQTRWVIFYGPEQHGRPGTRFYTLGGKATESRGDAAKFSSFESAQEFAKEKGIALDGALRYIGQADFTEWELRNS